MAGTTTGLEPGTTFADRYEVLGALGCGGMGEVYRVLDREIGEEVALKLLRAEITLDPRLVERFRNELKFARRITHPNVCRVYHFGEHAGAYYITMELVAGEDLTSLLRRSGPLEATKVVAIARQVCAGLAEAHRHEVVHRDLKPQNVMIDRQGRVRVMDFGIARHLGTAGMTETGMIVGTPEYMAPEQIDGTGLDARSDVYAVGVMLFEMTTGRPPFEGPTPLAVAVQHQTAAPPDPRALNAVIPDALAQLILTCLAKDRRERFQSVVELLAALDRVEGAAPGPARAARAPVKALQEPAFVAREEELAVLDRMLDEALAGRGRVAFVVGEAGSGKTALVDRFAQRVQDAHPDVVAVSGRCDAHTGTGDPYMPFREVLSLLTGDVDLLQGPGDGTGERVRRLLGVAPAVTRSMLEVGSDLIGTLVSATGVLARADLQAAPGTAWVEQLRALVERRRTVPADSTLQQSSLLDQLTRVLQAAARVRPLLVTVDDLQWADTGSINALFHLGRRVRGSRIVFLGAYRPSDVALGREGQRHPLERVVNELRRDFGDLLIDLDREADPRFVDALLDGQPNRLGPAFRDTLLRHTGGNPLFTIELLRTLEERGWLVRNAEGEWVEAREIDWNTVPARVDAVVAERVGAVPDSLREALRVASVEGGEFTAEVVARVQGVEPGPLVRLLSNEIEKRHHLVRARGVSRVNGTRLSHYAFQHMLFQRHLYGELDEVERPLLHDAVGTALEALHGERAEEIAVQLARHFREAGAPEKAVDYLHRAGTRAVRVSANEEAITHFTEALRVLESLPPGPDRMEKELTLQLALAPPMQWSRGMNCPELARATARAAELCEQVRDPRQTIAALTQLTLFYATRPDYRRSLELLEQLNARAAESGDADVEAIPLFLPAWALLNLASFPEVVEHAERAMARYVPARDSLTAYVFGFEFGVLNLGFASWARWFLGQPDGARRCLERALALAREHAHPYTMAFILVGGCELYWFLRDPDSVVRCTEELAPLADEKGFVYWQAHAAFYRGEQLVREGCGREGLARMHGAIEGMRATGTDTCLTRLGCRMAQACEEAGEYDQAAAAIQHAIELMERYDERYMEAEIYRRRGCIALHGHDDMAHAEEDFAQAIAVARRQKALSLELRATMSLARLWHRQGRGNEAHARLADVYGRFTEGFDTPDLEDARALLASLPSG
jgi:tetratricopeptide (TPR) repeat protein